MLGKRKIAQELGNTKSEKHQTNGDGKKKEKRTSNERENFSKPSSAAEISSK